MLDRLPPVRGRYTQNAPLGDTSWFRCGGCAEVLYKPADADDLAEFLKAAPADIPVRVLGVCSNTIIRDGGIRGVTIRLGGAFAGVAADPETGMVKAGAAALDVNVAEAARRASLAGLEFLSGIPGTVGGALRMNAGAYGREIADVLVTAHTLDRAGNARSYAPGEMGLGYRHNDLAEDVIFTGATLQATPGAGEEISARMAEIKEKREGSQPIRARTGGSTFANPKPEELQALNLPQTLKAWQMIDAVGGRGLMVGGAQMSDQHCNFMLNTGGATAADLENLGEEIRKRVHDKFGYDLRWEIKRIGE